MFRTNLAKSVLLLFGLSSFIYATDGRSTMVREFDISDGDEDYVEVRRRKDEEGSPAADVQWLGLGKRQPRFTPYVSVGLSTGVLSDMQQFFDNLRTNLDSLDTLPPEERDALMGKAPAHQEKDQYFRPAATAAYLHALRNQRPSYKIRNFVESPEPATLRGTNHYDPSLLWTGLGRRKR